MNQRVFFFFLNEAISPLVVSPPVPSWYVEEVPLVVVHHQLDDDAGVLAVVLQADHPHDVGHVLDGHNPLG